ncbi:MAG TPA: EF-hand domain-containing protein [Usitatibacter sp.]|nr:EF-hand domain-containing protein [Usitatibacter sp.]
MKYVAILTALGLGSAAMLALADPALGPFGPAGDPTAPGHHGQRLRAADTNGDGMISRDEAAALPRLARHFDEIDANHDGQITREELRAYFKQARASRWKKIDTDGDGRISLAEAQANAPRLAQRFGQLDTNGDGFLTPEELRAAHRRPGASL